jgi:hypothetical protein
MSFEAAGSNSDAARQRWPLLVAELRRRLGPGAPLPSPTRARFEGQLGGDLSGAMVHRSPLAGLIARSVGAEAASADAHVIGDADALDDTSSGGAGLLGHELAHVVQRAQASTPDAEFAAQVVEREIATSAAAAPVAGADAEVDAVELTERVYRRMVAQLWRERERGAWIN